MISAVGFSAFVEIASRAGFSGLTVTELHWASAYLIFSHDLTTSIAPIAPNAAVLKASTWNFRWPPPATYSAPARLNARIVSGRLSANDLRSLRVV